MTSPPKFSTRWFDAFSVYLELACVRMFFLGFSAGLPLLLVFGTLSFWLREAGIDHSTIGYLSGVGLAYSFKWVWAPLVDRLPIPWLTSILGQRRSWLLLAQCAILLSLSGMAMSDPSVSLTPMVWCALATAFASATQDISLDAYRIESASVERQAALAAAYQTGYRLAMIWAGAGALWLAAFASDFAADAGYQYAAWRWAYLVMSASMFVGIVTVLFSPEPVRPQRPPARTADEWLRETLIAPFADFLRRYRSQAVLILALIAVYRISDVVMGIMANPFYVDMGYKKEEVATVMKFYGVLMTLAGAFVGGALTMRFGVMRILMLGAVLSASSNLLFAWLAGHERDLVALILVISTDSLSAGLASAAFIAYLSSLTNINYSATQYALFSSIMLLLPKTVAVFSGSFVASYGYATFFIGTALLGVPVLWLVHEANRQLSPAIVPRAAQTSETDSEK